MDPISAAGIGLGVTSLALQLFSGCVTAYQLFLGARNMPATYQFLRVRLRFEQSRLLRWGEKVGLAEELLDKPSRVLQLNRNLIFDMLLEIQALFKETVKVQSKFDSLVLERNLPLPPDHNSWQIEQSPEGRFLKKALKVFNKLPEAPQRLEWALVKQDHFKGLVEQLIGYNDAIEGLLEVGAIEQLLETQRQTYMSVLQLNSKVDDLKQISLAMQVKTIASPHTIPHSGGNKELITMRQTESHDLAELANFKAQQSLIETETSTLEPLAASEIQLEDDDDDLTRCEAIFGAQNVWIEWKEYNASNENPKWGAIITQRVQKLVSLLKSEKSPHFGAPNCLGYFSILGDSPNITRYGFVYEKPAGISPETPPTSLYDQFLQAPKPSLTQRTALAYTIARSLMYLHSVNWLHKTFRSNNIVFFLPASKKRSSYASPIISGFEYSRLDLVDEQTEIIPEHSENSIYRHPQTLARLHLRSKKSHDIYSLGIVLIEIAYWQRIHDIVNLPDEERQAKKMIRGLRETLLGKDKLEELEGLIGDSYSRAVVSCLKGLVSPEADEENPVVGIQIQEAFYNRVVVILELISI